MFNERRWAMRSLSTYIFVNLMWDRSLMHFGGELIVCGLLVMIEDRYREFRARND